MARREGWPPELALARCTEVDRTRRQFVRYFFGDAASQSAHYDWVVNTGRVPLPALADTAVQVVRGGDLSVLQPATADHAAAGQRVLTLARELGAGEQGFAPPLAERLGLHVWDRELLEQQAIRLGVPEDELDKIDEQPAGLWQRFRPEGIYQRYFQALGQLTRELADRGEVLLVGRGGCWFLRDHPTAFHVHLTAMPAVRLRRVMEYRWVREDVAKKMLAQSDAQRRRFCENYFGADWFAPLEYHLTVNTGRLGPSAVDAVAWLAERYWNAASPG